MHNIQEQLADNVQFSRLNISSYVYDYTPYGSREHALSDTSFIEGSYSSESASQETLSHSPRNHQSLNSVPQQKNHVSNNYDDSFVSWTWYESFLRKTQMTRQSSSCLMSTLIMTNVAVGQGLLNFPRAFADVGGIVPGLIMQLIIYLFTVYSLYILGYTSRLSGGKNYQNMIQSHCGSVIANICRGLIIINVIGAAMLLIVVLGDQVEFFMQRIDSPDVWFKKRYFLILIISSIIIFPLSCMKNINVFVYTSFLGIISAIFITFVVVIPNYFYLKYPKLDGEMIFDRNVFWNNLGFVTILPLLAYAFEGHTEVPIMRACLKDQHMSYYMRTVVSYTSIAYVIYALCGIFGYWTFGKQVNSDILLSYDKQFVTVNIASALLIIKVITAIPIYILCLRTVIEDLWRLHVSPRISSNSFIHSHNLRGFIETLVLLVIIVTLGIFVPNLTSAIALTGGLSAIFAFILPGR